MEKSPTNQNQSAVEPVVPCPVCNGIAWFRFPQNRSLPTIARSGIFACAACDGSGRFEDCVARLLSGEFDGDLGPHRKLSDELLLTTSPIER